MAKSKKEVEMEVDKEKKKMGIGKIIAVVLIVFTMIPVIIVSVIYFTNENFKFTTNKYLSSIKGPVGAYFQSFPTREEKEKQKKQVARFFVDLDTESASDKLLIIKNEDEALYKDLVKIMTEMNAKQTSKILERIRGNSIKKDVLASTIEQIEADQMKDFQERAKYFEKASLTNAVHEINNKIANELISYKSMAAVMEQMKEDSVARILMNLDGEMANRLLSNYELKDKKKKVEEILNKMKDHEKELINIATIYDSEKPEKLLSDIGNEKKYKIDDLSTIYRNMSMIQGAEVLSEVEDKNFVYMLLEKIKTDEILKKGKDTLTTDLMKAMKVFSEHNKEIDEMVKVYGKMEPSQIGSLITKLFKSRNAAKKYTFENGDTITISDQDIAISILRKLKEKTVAEILTTLDHSLASEISRKLTLPK